MTTLAAATLEASSEAQRCGQLVYVFEQCHDFASLQAGIDSPHLLPDHVVEFGWSVITQMPLVLRLEHPSTGITLTVLRVARPDGTVAPVADPRSHEARLRQFCNLDDQALKDEIALLIDLDVQMTIEAAEYDEDEALAEYERGLAEGEGEGPF